MTIDKLQDKNTEQQGANTKKKVCTSNGHTLGTKDPQIGTSTDGKETDLPTALAGAVQIEHEKGA